MIGYTEEDYTVLKTFEYEEDGKKHKYELRQKKEREDFGIDPRFLDHFKGLKERNPKDYNNHIQQYKDSLKPYISIDITNSEGQTTLDLLLSYSKDIDEAITHKDWNLITTDKTIKVKDLSHDSLVKFHSDVYLSDGTHIMY